MHFRTNFHLGQRVLIFVKKCFDPVCWNAWHIFIGWMCCNLARRLHIYFPCLWPFLHSFMMRLFKLSCCHKPRFILFEPNYVLNFKWFLVFTMINLINWKLGIHSTIVKCFTYLLDFFFVLCCFLHAEYSILKRTIMQDSGVIFKISLKSAH